MALGAAKGNVEQISLSKDCYDLNKKVTMEELRSETNEADRNWLLDPAFLPREKYQIFHS